MNLLNGKLIIIYGKVATYKSTIAKLFLNSDNSYYVDMEDKKYSKDDLAKIVSTNDVVVVDYIELMDLNIDEIKSLKEMIENTNKTIILVSCCVNNKGLINDNYNKLKEISDLIITTDKWEVI